MEIPLRRHRSIRRLGNCVPAVAGDAVEERAVQLNLTEGGERSEKEHRPLQQ